jgi:hypothetical protein
MSTQTIYLHLGTYKTATTFIQSVLRKNYCEPGHEIFYPPEGLHGDAVGHHYLASANYPDWEPLRSEEAFHKNWSQTIDSIRSSGAEHVIISSELMCSLQTHEIQQIQSILSGFSLKAIIYLRRQDQYVSSLASQVVKGCHWKKMYYTDLAATLDELQKAKNHDYWNMCERWSQIIGKDNLIVRAFEKGQFVDGNILDDFFFSLLGIKAPHEIKLPVQNPNPRLCRDALEFKQLVNRLPMSRNHIQKILRCLYAYSTCEDDSLNLAFYQHTLLSPQQQQALWIQHKESNRRIAMEFMGRSDGILFKEMPMGDGNNWAPYEGLNIDRIHDILRFIQQQDSSVLAQLVRAQEEGCGQPNGELLEWALHLFSPLESASVPVMSKGCRNSVINRLRSIKIFLGNIRILEFRAMRGEKKAGNCETDGTRCFAGHSVTSDITRNVKDLLKNNDVLYRSAKYIYRGMRYVRHILRFEFNDEHMLYVSKKNGFVKRKIGWYRKNIALAAYDATYEDEQDFSELTTDIKAIAYYLPQFHAIPENDEWWGDGFTEWTNTEKAKPLFPGHYQPREPHDDIGFYDLNDSDVLKKQAEMAKRHGIHGFCFYHYWFGGTRLLGKPVDLFLERKDIDFPFCLCWANETWSRRWDGEDHHILIEQTHSAEDDIQFIEFLAPYLKDSRYIRVNGKAMILVYQVGKMPEPKATVQRWRNWCRENGVGEIHVVAVCHYKVYPLVGLDDIGFDAFAAFPPHSFPCNHVYSDLGVFGARGYRFDYASGVEMHEIKKQDNRLYAGCMMGWDNTARLGKNAQIFLNYSSEMYSRWLRECVDYSREVLPEDERYLFINAWNEWAEGTYLEPDKKYGYASLNATSRVLFD